MKKFVPILLVICTVLSVFSIFTVPAYALAEGAAIVLLGLASFCIGECISNIGSQAGGELSNAVSKFASEHNSFINSTNSIVFNSSTGSFSISGEYDFSSQIEYDVAIEIVNELNNNPTIKAKQISESSRYPGFLEVDTSVYSEIKTIMTDRLSKAIYKQYYEEAGKNTEEIAEILDKPFYKFDFVGPMPAFTTPESTTQVSVSKDGFLFTAPCSNLIELTLNGGTSYYFPSKDAAQASGCSNPRIYYKSSDGTEYWCGEIIADCYGGGTYIIYNGEIYYKTSFLYTSDKYNRYFSTYGFNNSSFNSYLSIDGVCLSDVYNGGSFSVGAVINTTGEQHSPIPSISPSENDFTSTTGGAFSVNRTDDENNTGLGIGLGLINDSDSITLNPDGTFESVGGIDMAKLTDLIEQLKSGSLDFENVKQYLDLISRLVSSGNLTSQEQKVILDNINANTTAIAQAIAEAKAVDIDKVNVDFSTFLFEHIGFKEATDIVNGFTLVNQCKTLINNLLGKFENSSSSPPNFSFYWDSNKDGIKEKYTILDLSFMETSLSNSNLVDQSRFQNSMTVRQFVQYLIILLCYVAFTIKIIKKLPGLLGGVEGFDGDLQTVSTFESKVK